jgi:Ca-activated chloride channel family protein
MVRNVGKLLTLCAVGSILGMFSSNAHAGTQVEISTSADLELISHEGGVSSALRLNTELSGEVNGLVATITLRQTFRNPSPDWVNGRYVFPLPENAAIDSLSLETDGRIIRGVVKEKQAAKRAFEAAKASGKKAGLLQQNRPNLFSMSLANIAPDSDVIATITWVQTVDFKAGLFSLRLPTTLTPRFIPGQRIKTTEVPGREGDFVSEQALAIDSGTGWSLNTDRVPDAAEITPWQILQPEQAGSHQFSLDMMLDAGLALSSISSVSHALDVSASPKDPNRQRIRFSNGLEPLDRDLLIHWAPVASQQPDAAVFQQAGSEGDYSLLMVMPPMQNIVQTLRREVIFIIDSSGSMAGISMPQARRGLRTALGYLSPTDRFNIVDFDSSANALFSEPVAASRLNLSRADAFVSSLVADGGTNMNAALKMAFKQRREDAYLRQIIFITDGSVGNEEELFRLIQSRLGDARLFTVGIGSAPNSHFMRGAAHYGRGSYENIASLDQAEKRMNALFARINRPVMSNLKIQWPDNKAVEMYPAKIPDLYLGEPLMVLARSTTAKTQVNISGQLAGKPWSRSLKVSGAPKAKNLDKLWARQKIDALISAQVVGGEPVEKIKAEIVKLGVEHQLSTRYTSFVAIEEKISKPEHLTAKNKQVPNLMPKGNTMMVPLPNTATPANLLLVMGVMLILLGGILLRPAWAEKWVALAWGEQRK